MQISWRIAAIGAGCAAIVPLLSAQTSPATSTEAFIVSDLSYAFYRGDEKTDCPDGRSFSLRDAYLQTRAPAERERLLKPENAAALDSAYKNDYVFGPGGKDICTDAELFATPEHPLQKPFRGPVAPGMDLDGATPGHATPGTCRHDSFTSPTGERGVDNQMYRATGCNTMWRGIGEKGRGELSGPMSVGKHPVAIVVAGVDDWQDDPHVEVLVAAVADRPPLDAKQVPMAGSSVTLSANPRYRMRVTGSIRNGVLTTDPGDFILPYNWVGASGGEYIARHVRLRLTRNKDGELSGALGGYRPIDNVIAMFRVGGPGVASTAGVDCSSLRQSLGLFADGDPDQAGKCTSVSTALNIAARPAFVYDGGKLLNGRP
ncbi:hypothetical protein ACFOD9_07515 [Novosphingobium bradum]|uniref:Uncharacterized protein n=1 Tax=Novosphingobium bradum TaxID=1737444 RepID=A0ABV7IN25_9SPHN